MGVEVEVACVSSHRMSTLHMGLPSMIKSLFDFLRPAITTPSSLEEISNSFAVFHVFCASKRPFGDVLEGVFIPLCCLFIFFGLPRGFLGWLLKVVIFSQKFTGHS